MMLGKPHILFTLPALLAWAGLFLACTREDARVKNASEETVPVEFAVSVFGPQAKSTKGSISDITEISDSPVFRGMRNIYLLPFASFTAVRMSDRSLSYSLNLEDISSTTDTRAVNGLVWHSGLVAGNNAHLYREISLPKSTGSVLVYGQAVKAGSYDEGSVDSKKLNGSMIVTGITSTERVRYPSGISFAPEAIYSETATPTAATSLVSKLNSLFNSNYTISYYTRSGRFYYTYTEQNASVAWNGSTGDTRLRNYFNEFTGEGKVMGGSGSCIEAMLTLLYRNLKNRDSNSTGNYNSSYYSNNSGTVMTNAEWYNRLRDAICTRIESLGTITGNSTSNYVFRFSGANAALTEYPSSLGLPDGCSAIRWNGSQFIVVDNADPANGMAERGAYCYPASLWYFSNSTVKTSVRDDESDHYISSNTSWSSILSEYSGNSVSSSTQSVAVVEPLRYGPGLLEVKIKAQGATLSDNDNDNSTNVTVGSTNFPLTGILVGGQRVQAYNFTPMISGDETIYSIYDTKVQSASGTQIYLTTSASPTFKTLVFPTPDNADIAIALEFKNNSGNRFYGADGQVIPAGGTFYLIGQLKITDRDEDARRVGGTVLNAVFTHTFKTTATFTVSSLKDAVNTIPDLKEPQLTLGVSADIDWILITPGNLPLY